MSIRIAASSGRCPCRRCQRLNPARGWVSRMIQRAIEEGLIEDPKKRRKR